MNSPQALDILLLQPRAPKSQRPQSDTVADDAQVLNAFAAGQSRAQRYCPRHDSVSEFEVDLRIPVALLVAAT